MLIVAVCSSGLSFADNLFLHGRYQVRKRCPIIPGLEGVGIITATSRGVSPAQVCNIVGFGSLQNGGCAEEVLLPCLECVQFPQAIHNYHVITYSALGTNYTTAYFALVYRASVPQWGGRELLILGAAGGVGIAAI